MFKQQTPSQRLRNVLTVLPGRSDLLSNVAANGSVTGTVGWGRARRKLSLVNRLPEGSPPDPTVAVVICAGSEVRWDDLVAAVESVKRQTYRPAEIVLVIDHNPALQRRSTNELTGVTVVPNDNEGLPGARNAGVAAASSEIVAFVEDDAVAERNWLAALVAPYADPHVLGVGGQVVPIWQTRRPNWFPAEFDWVVGCSYHGMPAERTRVRNFSGASMSLRRRPLVESGGFDETEICARLQRRYLDGVYLYEPKALVRRHVPCSRSTWSYYRSRCYTEGLSKAAVRDLAGPEWTMSSEKSFVRSIIPRAIGRNLVKALRGEPSGLAGVMALTGGVFINGIGYTVGRIRLPGNTKSTQARWPTMTELGAIG